MTKVNHSKKNEAPKKKPHPKDPNRSKKNEAPKKKLHPMDPKLLQTFWDLSDKDEEKRCKGCSSLVNILSQPQVDTETSDDLIKKLSSEMEYSLVRLIRGLSSSRDCACPGFAMALTQVLRVFKKSVTVAKLLEVCDKELSISGSESKQEVGDKLKGKVMLFLSLIQSGLIKQASSLEVEVIVKSVIDISQQKSYLQQLCIHALGQISSKVSKKIFKNVIFPLINDDVSSGWDDCKSPNSLLLLMLVHKAQPEIISEDFLEEKWERKKLLSHKNYSNLSEVMTKSTANHPLTHTVCYEILDMALQGGKFENYWSKVVLGNLSNGNMNQKYLALQLVSYALTKDCTAAHLKAILDNSLIELLIKNLTQNKYILHQAAKKMNDSILKFVDDKADEEMQIVLLRSLLTHPGSIHFDSVTKTKTIHHIVQSLKPTAAEWFAENCIALFRGESPFGEMDESHRSSSCTWAASQLCNLTSLPGIVSHERHLSIAKFLFLHTFFNVNKTCDKIIHVEKVSSLELPSSSWRMMQGLFLKVIDHITSKKRQGDRRMKSFGKNVESILEIMDYAQSLLDCGNEYVTMKVNWNEEVKDEWNKIKKTVLKINKKHSNDTDLSDGHAFELMFLHLGLQLFHEPKQATEALRDLHICYHKAFHKRRKSTSSEVNEGPEWIEVITELFLSLLSQGSHLVRVVVCNVYKLLSQHMTTGAINLILDVIKIAKQNDDEENDEDDNEQLVFINGENNDDDADDESMSPDENIPSTESETDEEKVESDSDDEDEDEDNSDVEEKAEAVDENFRATVKAALGYGADDSSKEDSEVEELDDDAMFKLDDVLVEAFRSMVKVKKVKDDVKKHEAMLHYRVKCLDLLLIQVKQGESSAAILLEMVFPLLRLVESCADDRKQKTLGNKAAEVFNVLCKHKKVPLVADDRELICNLMRELVEFSTKVSTAPLVDDVSNAAAFIIKLLDYNPNEAQKQDKDKHAVKDLSVHSKEVFEVVRSSLQDFMEKRDSRFNHLFFKHLCLKHRDFLWPLSVDLLKYIADQDLRIFCRTKACEILGTMINKSLVTDIQDDWNALFSNFVEVVTNGLNESVSKGNFKVKFLEELLSIFVRFVTSSSRLQISGEIPQSLKTIVTSVKKGTNSKDLIKSCNRVLNLKGSNSRSEIKNLKRKVVEVAADTEKQEPQVRKTKETLINETNSSIPKPKKKKKNSKT